MFKVTLKDAFDRTYAAAVGLDMAAAEVAADEQLRWGYSGVAIEPDNNGDYLPGVQYRTLTGNVWEIESTDGRGCWVRRVGQSDRHHWSISSLAGSVRVA